MEAEKERQLEKMRMEKLKEEARIEAERELEKESLYKPAKHGALDYGLVQRHSFRPWRR